MMTAEIFANENHNIRIKSQNKDFGNKVFSNNIKRCGQRKYQDGDRKSAAVLYLTGENFIVENGTFDCSLQNTVYIQRAQNLVIQNLTSSRGSDNSIEIRDSFFVVQNSTFKDSVDNKCEKTENRIVVFYSNTFSGKSGYTFRKFGKKRDCLKVINISNELEDVIISGKHSQVYELVRKTVEQKM